MTHPRPQSLSKNFSAAFGPLAACLVDIAVALFLVLGIATAIFLIPVVLEGWGGLFSIMDAARDLTEARNGSAPSMPDEGYAGNILSVVIISLTALGLLAAFITLAAILGLNAHANTLRHQIRDDITVSAHDVVRQMTHISAETQRAQAALDRSAHEWLARAGWFDDPAERPRALVRAFMHADRALMEARDARQRLSALDLQNRHLETVRQRVREVTGWLDWVEINTINTRCFFLAALYHEGVLNEDDKIARGMIPDKESARSDALEGVTRLEAYCRDTSIEIGFNRFKFRDTVIYVRDRMEDTPKEHLAEALEELLEDVAHSPCADREARRKWVTDRRADYAHLFSSEA